MFTSGGKLRVLISVIMAGLAVLTARGFPAADDAVLHYSFDEVGDGMVMDLSGNGYHGRIQGEPEKVDSGLRFTDESCLVVSEVSAMNVGGGGFTAEIELELEEDALWTVSEDGYGMLLSADYEGNPGAWMLYSNVKNRPGLLRFSVREGLTFSPEPLPAGEPLHIAVSLNEDPMWDTMRRELYIDGQLQPHMARGSAVPLEENVRIIVGAQEPGKRHFRGILRELRLYARPIGGEDDPVLERGRRLAEEKQGD